MKGKRQRGQEPFLVIFIHFSLIFELFQYFQNKVAEIRGETKFWGRLVLGLISGPHQENPGSAPAVPRPQSQTRGGAPGHE